MEARVDKMADMLMNRLIENLRLASFSTGMGRTDGELLDSFLGRDDGAAFEALIRRYGPMVWGVCRRALRSHQDAEDAFQATFLVLVQKAATLPDRETVGNWLYGVAHQTAVRMRDIAIRRGARERQVTVMPEPTMADEYLWNDLRPLLDEELSRLPNKYRLLIVLCDLEGHTRKEVAARLAIPEGTVASRLATAREMLAKRLTGRGVVASGSLLGTVLSTHATSAGVPAAVVAATLRTAMQVTAGAGAGALPPMVSMLVTGVTNAMLATKIKTALTAVLVLGVLATGATALTYRAAAGQDGKQPPAAKEEKPVAPPAEQQQPNDKVPFTAWGKEVGGLQAGLGFRDGGRVYHPGETVALVVRVRNVGKAKAKYSYRPDLFSENPPSVTGSDGKPVLVEGSPVVIKGLPRAVEIEVPPGETADLCEMKLVIRPATEARDPQPAWTLFGTGKHQFRYDRATDPADFGGLQSVNLLGKLDTGKLDLVVEDRAFTAWGEPTAGLQAGLGFLRGEHRVSHPGETAKVVLRVRNVGQDNAAFKYSKEHFHQNPPSVTNDKGGAVSLKGSNEWLKPRLEQVNLNAGDQIDLCVFDVKLRSPKAAPEDTPWALHGVGKFQFQYPKGTESPFPPLPGSGLDTGKLDLVVEDRVAFTAWGTEVDGWQMGLGFRPGERRVYHPYETAKLVVRFRNVGKQEAAVPYSREVFYRNPPSVTADNGRRVVSIEVSIPLPLGGPKQPLEVKVAPGEVVDLCELDLQLRPETERGNLTQSWALFGTGEFRLRYGRSGWSKLGTGTLDLEVRDRSAAADPKATFLKRPEEAKLNVASSPRFHPRVFVYRAEPICGKVADYNPDAQEVVLDVGLKDGVRFGHAFQIGTDKPGGGVAVAKVMELDGNGKRCVAKVVSLTPSHAAKSLKGMTAVATAPRPDKDKVAVEIRVGKNVWHTESLENKIIRGLLDAAGPDGRILIVQEKDAVEGGAKRVYTPGELIRAYPRGTGGDVSFTGKEKPADKGHVAVRFEVKVVQDSPPIKAKPDGKEWVAGHAPGDVRLRPDDNRPDDKQVVFEHKEFAVVLTARVREQLTRTGVRDFEKHFAGKTVRVTGPVAFSNLMSDVGDTLLYDLVVDDVSQFEAVE